mmetsp:Transcript_11538/g.20869  ORF Transcript_11538/g.20869 Transcript_11538/m.20869 type:complete len:231 (+) Transcript_11538:1620-2312(+)
MRTAASTILERILKAIFYRGLERTALRWPMAKLSAVYRNKTHLLRWNSSSCRVRVSHATVSGDRGVSGHVMNKVMRHVRDRLHNNPTFVVHCAEVRTKKRVIDASWVEVRHVPHTSSAKRTVAKEVSVVIMTTKTVSAVQHSMDSAQKSNILRQALHVPLYGTARMIAREDIVAMIHQKLHPSSAWLVLQAQGLALIDPVHSKLQRMYSQCVALRSCRMLRMETHTSTVV